MVQKQPLAVPPRKKRVLEEVQRHRRKQRTVTLAVVAIILIAVVAGGIYALTHQSRVLPAYLNECVSGSLAYHAHVRLSISLHGVNQSVPADIGIDGGCLHPLHTHTADGVIHVEPDQNRTFTIGDFFLIWGKPFNSTQVLDQKFSQGQVVMTVNGFAHSELGNYIIPPNAQAVQGLPPPGNPCSNTPSCQEVDIVISAPSTAPTS